MARVAVVEEESILLAAGAAAKATKVEAIVGEEVAGTYYFQRINPQLLNIEYSSERGGIIMEEEELFIETGEFSIPSRPQRRMKISYITV